jgi:hypothetical protein
MIYKQTSVKEVIAKVLADNDSQENTHRIPDMIQWAGEALEKIGAFPTLETHVAGKEGLPLIEVTNYQAQLPTGLHGIIQAAYSENGNAPYYPMRTATGSFDSNRSMTVVGTTNTENEKSAQTAFDRDLTYVTTGNYIKLNVPTGYILLAYTSIPVDDDGYPLVPDDISFLDALYWYITMKLIYPKWVEGRVRDAVYFDTRSSWNYYRKQAYGTAMMPNGDQLTSIKNTWNKLIPELNEQNTFFSTIGEEQQVYNNNGKNYSHGTNNSFI